MPVTSLRIDPVSSFYKIHTRADVLRLDLMHPVVSGNKWYKLKEYLADADLQNKHTIGTFGGAYSNHILATAYACHKLGFESIGIIRGERPLSMSETLKDAESFGMKLFFVSRDQYKHKILPPEISKRYGGNLYMINEGGYGKPGATGASSILTDIPISSYTHILAAAGTGTTVAGLALAGTERQKIVGISVLKNHYSLESEIKELLPKSIKPELTLIHDYHFGGYAKYKPELINFMNEWFQKTGIPSDFVYTGKLFFAVDDLVQKNYFPEDSRLLIIHSGGLQGNRSLQNNALIY